MEVLDKLTVRTTDFVATIGVDDGEKLSRIVKSVSGMSCVSEIKKDKFDALRNVKFVKNIKKLESDIFNKVWAEYSDTLNLKQVVRVAEDFGLVLITNVPKQKYSILVNTLANKAGIFDVWATSARSDSFVDLLFKARKYMDNE